MTVTEPVESEPGFAPPNSVLTENTSLHSKNSELRWARKLLEATVKALKVLEQIVEQYGFSVHLGDILYLDRRWYVTHTGLLRIAQRNRCYGIHICVVDKYSNLDSHRWAFAATVYKTLARLDSPRLGPGRTFPQ